jgi:hypothetical protein
VLFEVTPVSDELNLGPVIPEPDRLPRQVRPVPHSLRLRVWREDRVMHGTISGLVPAAVWQETLDAFYAQAWGCVSCLDVSRAVLTYTPPPPRRRWRPEGYRGLANAFLCAESARVFYWQQ